MRSLRRARTPKRCAPSLRATLYRASSPDDAEQDRDDRNDQQDVDQPAGRAGNEAEKPENDEDDGQGVKHGSLLFRVLKHSRSESIRPLSARAGNTGTHAPTVAVGGRLRLAAATLEWTYHRQVLLSASATRRRWIR